MKQIQNYEIELSKSLEDSFNTAQIQSEHLYAPFIQIVVSGASELNGTFTVEGTTIVLNAEPINWVKLTEFADKAVTADGTVYWFLPSSMLSMKFIRIKYTSAAGTGTAKIVMSATRT